MVSGIPFNDAYRYMDWLLTVPLLLIEILERAESDGHRHSLQRCIPLHGLAFDCAAAAYRDPARHEVVTGRFQRQSMETRCWLCLDDFLRLLWRAYALW